MLQSQASGVCKRPSHGTRCHLQAVRKWKAWDRTGGCNNGPAISVKSFLASELSSRKMMRRVSRRGRLEHCSEPWQRSLCSDAKVPRLLFITNIRNRSPYELIDISFLFPSHSRIKEILPLRLSQLLKSTGTRTDHPLANSSDRHA